MALDAHAALAGLSSDPKINAMLIQHGYANVRAVAEAPRSALAKVVAPSLGDFKTAQLQVEARAQVAVLDHLRTAYLVKKHTGTGGPPQQPQPNEPISPDVCRCEDCEAGLSPLAYLVDLLDFTVKHIVDGQTSLTLDSLTQRLHQPFGDLIASCDAVSTPIRQVRIASEVLRSLLGQTSPDDSAYRQAAYLALLDRLGVSYEEIRAAHTAPSNRRQALADRLGIEMGNQRPDNLDSLLFDLSKPAQPTEKNLADLFGLPDSHIVALTPPQNDPTVVTWQLNHLRTIWKAAPPSATPVIDPDMIDIPDFAGTLGNNPAYTIRQARAKAVVQEDSALRNQAGNQPGNVDAVISAAIGTSVQNLQALAAQYAGGQDIQAQLVPLHLTLAAFTRLLDLRTFITGGATVLDSEWDEFYGILTQAWKRQQFAAWVAEETSAGIVLSPDLFRIPPDPGPSAAAFVFKPWRGTLRARQAWQDALQARIDEMQTAREALANAVDAAEEATLTRLRDVLLLGSSVPGADLAAKATQFTNTYFIDAETSACHKTTRVAQATETLQDLIFAVRSGQLLGQSTLQIDPAQEDTFDEDWRWMGSYATWQAAMQVFLYPDNILVPSLRPIERQTPAFQRCLSSLPLGTPLPAEQVCQAVQAYSAYFHDICTLTPDASCLAFTNAVPHTCDGWTPPEVDRWLFYMFARGASGTAYWSAAEPDDISSDYAQRLWDVIPGLGATARIVGAVPYEPDPVQRYICVLAITFDKSTRTLVSLKYDLTRQRWDASPTALAAPQDAGAFTAAVKQVAGKIQPPSVAIRTAGGAILERRLAPDAGDWEAAGWRAVVNPHDPMVGTPDLLGIVASNETDDTDGYLLFTQPASGDAAYKYLRRGCVPLYGLVGPSSGDGYFYTTRLQERDGARGQGYKDLGIVGYVVSPDVPQPAGTVPLYHVRSGSQYYTTDAQHRADMLKGQGVYDYGITGYIWTGPLPTSTPFHYVYDTANGAVQHEVFTADPTVYKAAYAETANQGSGTTIGHIIDSSWGQLIQMGDLGGGPLTWLGALSWGLHGGPYVFFNQGGSTAYVQPVPGGPVPTSQAFSPNLGALAVHCGGLPPDPNSAADAPSQYVAAEELSSTLDPFRMVLQRAARNAPVSSNGEAYVAPRISGPFSITERQSEADLQDRRAKIATAFSDTSTHPASDLIYLEEAYYFVPVQVALQRQSCGDFPGSMDWFRTVYDFNAPVSKRLIYYGFVAEKSLPATYSRLPDWLRDPLNPHRIAETREGCYLRYTLIALIRCILDYADSEFTRDTAESVERARLLYLMALALLDDPALGHAVAKCPNILGTVDVGVPSQYAVTVNDMNQQAQAINDGQMYEEVATQVQHAMAAGGSWDDRFDRVHQIIADAKAKIPAPKTIGTLLKERPQLLTGADQFLLAQPDVGTAVDAAAAASARTFAGAVSAVSGYSLERLNGERVALPWLLGDGAAGGNGQGGNGQGGDAGQVGQQTPQFVPGVSQQFCVPLNPILLSLRTHAEMDLYKLRHCRNIAGLVRELDPYAAGAPQPTPYRYATLMERARQMAAQAQQLEAAYLAALEKRDAEAYNEMKARQDMDVARAGVRLQDLRVTQAQAGVQLAQVQWQRTQDQVDHYSSLIDEGLSPLEIAGLVFQATGVASLIAGSVMKNIEFWSAVTDAGGGVTDMGNAMLATSSMLQTMAGYERRREDWEFQRTMALDDARAGMQQIVIAQDTVQTTLQEYQIAQLQTAHAQAIADFLAQKFTNAELYAWMSGVLGSAYRYFLQQASATARTASVQLAFERQEVIPQFIQADYWDAPAGTAGPGNRAPDRQGLTGSARLLADMARLDQYAFDTNTRKLQLSKTFSLASLMPAEFQRFRETGVLPFATLMEHFDRDFPGQFARLIRRVRVSVVALIPPAQGVRATLSNPGTSRAVVGTGFQTAVVRRDPQMVALSSPSNASGVFELDVQPELLLPFEGLGVDTVWELRMPRAANPFDFRTIADVQMTVDYTALYSIDYQQQVVQSLKPRVTADRPFSFRYQFADQWYDLHNPDQTATPMVVTFTTAPQDFPPNIDSPTIAQVVLYFARADGAVFEVNDVLLRFTPQGGGGPFGGNATSVDGVISTRRGNAGSWIPMIGQVPVGEWSLDLTADENIRVHLQNEEVTEILFVITYAGRTPAWPA